MIDRYGFHINDIGLLASALACPATRVMGAEAYPQLEMKAAALLDLTEGAFEWLLLPGPACPAGPPRT